MMKLKTALGTLVAATAILGGTLTAASITAGETIAAQTSSPKAIVDAAIAKGIVGETASGYLALVSGAATPEILNAMNEINAGRKSVYTRLARQQNVQIEVVAALTGEKQLAKAAPGTMIMTKQGTWIKVR